MPLIPVQIVNPIVVSGFGLFWSISVTSKAYTSTFKRPRFRAFVVFVFVFNLEK